jgi:flagellar motor switch protein FliG
MRSVNIYPFIFLFLTWSSLAFGQAAALDTIERTTESPSLLELIKGGQRSASTADKETGSEEKEYVYSSKNLNGEKLLVTQELARYIDKNDFSVDVRLEEVFIRKKVKRNENIDGLPGVLQRVSREKSIDQLIDSRTQVFITLNKGKVEENTAFFKRLIANNLSLNPSTDFIQIDYINFPVYKSGDQSEDPNLNAQNLVPTSEYIQEEPLVEDLIIDVPEDTLPNTDEPSSSDLFSEYFWFWIIGLILLLATVIALLIRRNRRKARLAAAEMEEDGTMEELEKSLSNNKLKKIASEAFDTSSPNLKRSEFKKLLIETPESVGTFMNAMIENQEIEGLIFFSSLARPYPDLVALLKPFMEYSSYLTMLNQIDTPEEDKLDSESMDKFLLTFNSTVRALSNEKLAFKDEKQNVFGFLNQLSNYQIVQLIRGDRPEISSVLFSQMDQKRRMALLDLIEDNDKSEILMKVVELQRLPLSVIKEIGVRYARKAQELVGLENIDIDGNKALIETLDEYDASKQKKLIDDIMAADLDRGQLIEQRFIGFYNLHKIEKDILRNALSIFETDILINACFGLDKKPLEAILESRPPRERDMIESEISSGNRIASDIVRKARKAILDEVRKYL